MYSRLLFAIAGLLIAGTVNPVWAGKSVDSYPPFVRKHFVEGERLRDLERWREAVAAFNEAIRLGMGDCAEIYLPLAECYRKLGEHGQVVSTCTRLIEEFDLNSACRHWMVEAHRGRSAAYEALGKRDQAIGDLSTLVLLHEQELSIRKELKDRNLVTLLEDTARSHRDRARVLTDMGRRTVAQIDQERAGALETEARQLAASGPSGSPVQQGTAKLAEKPGWVRLLNTWSESVTIELDGATYTLLPGQEKKVRRSPGPFTYTVRGVASKVSSEVQAGEMVTIKVYPPKR